MSGAILANTRDTMESMTGVTIRKMEIDDLPVVLKIENACFRVPWSETGFFTYLIRNDTVFLVAEEKGEIAGYCGAVCAAEEADVTNVAVGEAYRNRGIGRALLKKLIHEVASRGVRTVFLEVRHGNKPAAALYEHFVFTRVGVRKDYYTQPTEDALVMRYVTHDGSDTVPEEEV